MQIHSTGYLFKLFYNLTPYKRKLQWGKTHTEMYAFFLCVKYMREDMEHNPYRVVKTIQYVHTKRANIVRLYNVGCHKFAEIVGTMWASSPTKSVDKYKYVLTEGFFGYRLRMTNRTKTQQTTDCHGESSRWFVYILHF